MACVLKYKDIFYAEDDIIIPVMLSIFKHCLLFDYIRVE